MRPDREVSIPIELVGLKPQSTFPICGDILRRIIAHNKNVDLCIDIDLLSKLAEIKDRQDILTGIKDQEDTDGDPRLYPYQRVGVEWLTTIKKGILADDQGLGKTVMAAQACAGLHRILNIGIICSSSNISSWASHMCQYFSEGIIWQDKERGLAVVDHDDFSHTFIANFENASSIRHNDLDVLIVDEAHHLRNRKTSAFKKIKSMARRIEYLFLLTATPTVNTDADLWTLLYLCDPDRFSSYWSLIFRFFEVDYTPFGMKVKNIKESERENFSKMISQYILHRDEDISSKMRTRWVDYKMSDEHRKIYDLAEGEAIDTLESGLGLVIKLTYITRLRQMAISPSISHAFSGRDKISAVVDMLKEDDRYTVVFTAFVSAATILGAALYDAGITCDIMTGEVPVSKRAEIQDRFGKDFRVLILTHKTGGESLTLVQATQAIFLDLAWHPAGNRHAAKRIHRIGQDKDVDIVFMRSLDSVEDQVIDIVMNKKEMTTPQVIKEIADRIRERRSV